MTTTTTIDVDDGQSTKSSSSISPAETRSVSPTNSSATSVTSEEALVKPLPTSQQVEAPVPLHSPSTGGSVTMSKETKDYMCAFLRDSGAMQETLDKLNGLEDELDASIAEAEKVLGDTNEVLRLLVGTLSVRDVSLDTT
ncbi:hypothetical protein diail_6738 [Diaporthe ilicicola]|nr:hypothetical protein diail_6738 [Diaporthe ilicicola]